MSKRDRLKDIMKTIMDPQKKHKSIIQNVNIPGVTDKEDYSKKKENRIVDKIRSFIDPRRKHKSVIEKAVVYGVNDEKSMKEKQTKENG